MTSCYPDGPESPFVKNNMYLTTDEVHKLTEMGINTHLLREQIYPGIENLIGDSDVEAIYQAIDDVLHKALISTPESRALVKQIILDKYFPYLNNAEA